MNAASLRKHIGDCNLSDKLPLAANVVMVLLFIPILNSLIYPFLREYMPNMVKRIGIGGIMAILAQVSILVISAVGTRREWTPQSTAENQCMLLTNFTNFNNSGFIERYAFSPVSEFYVLIPLFLITWAEVLINITSTFPTL